MDSDYLAEAADAVEHLAIGNSARVRLRQPLLLRQFQQSESGIVFEMEEDDEHFGDDEEDFTTDEVWSGVLGYAEGMFGLAGGGDGDGGSKAHFDPKIYSSFSEVEKEMTDLTGDGGSVKKMVMRPGSGKRIPERCKLFYHYMTLAEGAKEPFDTTLLRKSPFLVDLREEKGRALLPGLEIAIRSMEVKEVASFIVVPKLAYGVMGCPPRVPENCRILFVVEAVQIIEESLLKTPLYMSSDERAALPFATIMTEVNKLCTDGNGHYKDGSYPSAIRKYRKARGMLEDYPTQGDEDDEKRSKGIIRLCINIAQAYLKFGKAPQACVSCKLGLRECQDEDKRSSVELLWRFASAKLLLKDAEGAKSLIDRAAALIPRHEDVKRVQDEVSAETKKQAKNYSAMCKRMFGGKENGGG